KYLRANPSPVLSLTRIRTISAAAILRTISPYTHRIVSSLVGQSVRLCGQPSHVASCCSHSAGIARPSSFGVGSLVAFCIKPASIEIPRRKFNSSRMQRTQAIHWFIPRPSIIPMLHGSIGQFNYWQRPQPSYRERQPQPLELWPELNVTKFTIV